MKKLFLIGSIFLLTTYFSSAQEIRYEYIPYSNSVRVTHFPSYNAHYSGYITIPPAVQSQGRQYVVGEIGNDAFNQSKDLISVTIPYTVTEIGNSAFRGCSKLKKIFIPMRVRTIGDVMGVQGVFDGCSNLQSITVDPNNDSYASQDGVLYDKDKKVLKYYPESKKDSVFYVPSSVIGFMEALNNNKYIKKIVFPSSITEIHCAFKDCPNLSKIVFQNSKPPRTLSLGEDPKMFCTFEVPVGSKYYYVDKGLKNIITKKTNITEFQNKDDVYNYLTSHLFTNENTLAKLRYDKSNNIIIINEKARTYTFSVKLKSVGSRIAYLEASDGTNITSFAIDTSDDALLFNGILFTSKQNDNN